MRFHWFFQLAVLATLVFFSEYIQHYLVVAGFSWIAAAILHYALLFGNAISLLVSILFQNRIAKILSSFVFGISFFVGSALLLSFQNGASFKEYELFSIAFSSLVIIGIALFWFEQNKTPFWHIEKTIWKTVAIFVAIGLSVGLSLFIRKPYVEDYKKYEPNTFTSGEKEVVQMMGELLGEDNPILNESRYLLTFFTPDCPHCKRVATFVEASRRGNRSLPVCAVIGGSEGRITSFLNSSGYTGKYVGTTNDTMFFSIVGNNVPKVYLIEDEGVKGIWGGLTFNYSALDLLGNQ